MADAAATTTTTATTATTVHEYRGVGYLYENWGADRVWVALEDVQSRVDEKRGELRSLISERYHDLIDSADAIVGMDRTVDEFKGIVAQVENASRALVQGHMLEDDADAKREEDGADERPRAANATDGGDSLDAQLRAADILTLAAVNIWESIDSQQLWKACDTFVEAERAFKSLPRPTVESPAQTAPGLSSLEERSFAALGLDPSQFSDLRVAAAKAGPGLSQPQMQSQEEEGEEGGLPATGIVGEGQTSSKSVWELYPFLRSHWSLVQEARQRILLEARALLESEDLNLDTTCGAIRAVIVLGDATTAQSVDRLLEARTRVLARTLQDRVPTALERSLTIMQQTIVDMADLYVSGSRLVGEVDLAHVRRAVTSWVQARAQEVARASEKILARISSVQALAEIQKRIIEIEVSGGASTDAASELDVDSWRAAAQACVDSALWADNSDELFLYPRMFADAVVARAAQVLEADFASVCATLERGTQRTLAASIESERMTDIREPGGAARERPEDGGGAEEGSAGDNDTDNEDDEAGTDEDERLYRRLGERLMSENAVDRAGAAVVLLHMFSANVSRLRSNRAALTVDGVRVDAQMNDLAKNTLGHLIDSLRRELAKSVDVFGTSVSALADRPEQDSPDDADDVFTALKRTLFLARIAEGLLVGDALEGLLDSDAQMRLAEELAKLSSNVHQVWADASLSMSCGVLKASLNAQDWSNARDWAVLHSGWERIPVNFSEDANDDDNEDLDFDEEDTIDLPGAVSPGVALFSFLLSKQVRLVGDSRFISSGSVLAQNVEDLVLLMDQGAPSRAYLDAAAARFCASSEQAVLRLAHGGLKLVQEAYRAHLERNAGRENEPAALQTIFDLHWFEWLLLVDQSQESTNEIPALIERLVDSHVDTVNWTLQESHLLARIKVYRERNALLFGPSLMVKARAAKTWTASSEYAFESAGEAQDATASSVYDTNNLLHLGYLPTHTLPRIPLLPIPSNIRSMHSRLAAHRKRTSSRTLGSPTAQGHGSGSSSSSTAQGSASTASVEAAAALKSIGQVGSNLFSQASSWLNR